MNNRESDTALRGIGPRVFISYSFRDQAQAEGLACVLRESGFQVRLEDDSSLIGRRLETELTRRIGDAECFIQLYTEAASNSHWVRKELKYAEDIKKEQSQVEGKFSYTSNELLIVPIVLHSHRLAETFGDLAFIDATCEGITPSSVDEIKKVCLQSVRIIEVDDESPHKLRTDGIGGHFESANLKKRVIFDASGYWLGAIDGLLEYGADADPEDSRAKRFIIQEREHRDDIKWMLEIIDVCVEELLLSMNMQASNGFIERDQFSMSLSLFYKIPFFMHFLEILSMARSARTITLSPEVASEVDELRDRAKIT